VGRIALNLRRLVLRMYHSPASAVVVNPIQNAAPKN
jgi:hypothetical protein